MNELIDTLSNEWDIPVLLLKPYIRKRLFEQALDQAQKKGFVLPVTAGLILAWKDELETSWLGRLAVRAWACCIAPPASSDLAQFAAKLTEFDAYFAALSGWIPFPQCEGFIDTGASVHSVIDGLSQENLNDKEDVKRLVISPLGDVPEHWIADILTHINKTTWRDRHAKDYKLDPQKVKQRRTSWIEVQLRNGDGFLVAVLTTNEELGAYLMVPLDRSRQIYGGPVVAGINAVGGSIHEGRWFMRKAILGTIRLTKSMWDAAIVQFQSENIAMSYIVNRSLIVRSCNRYDIHWHSD